MKLYNLQYLIYGLGITLISAIVLYYVFTEEPSNGFNVSGAAGALFGFVVGVPGFLFGLRLIYGAFDKHLKN